MTIDPLQLLEQARITDLSDPSEIVLEGMGEGRVS